MKSIKPSVALIAAYITAILIVLPLESCKVKPAPGICEVRVTNSVVDCDDSRCVSPKRCVLQKRKKGTANTWTDTSQPEDQDPAFEYRCVCRG